MKRETRKAKFLISTDTQVNWMHRTNCLKEGYQGEPHGFMITKSGELFESFVAQNAYEEMIDFFDRTLKNSSGYLTNKQV